MIVLLITLLTAIFSTIASYLDKIIITEGMSRKDYFYYMCLSMVPFAVISIVIEYFTVGIKFKISLLTIILLIIGMAMRYYKQMSHVGVIRKLDPYETQAYKSIGILIAYIIDVLIGSQRLSIISIVSIIVTLVGIFILSDAKIKRKTLKKDLAVKIFGELLIGYVVYFILKFWSNGIYILLLNLFLTIIFSKNYNIKYHRKNKKIIYLVFVQQFFGFIMTYLEYYLASISVTNSRFVIPITLVFTFLFAYITKQTKRKPKLKEILAIALIIVGIVLINLI